MLCVNLSKYPESVWWELCMRNRRGFPVYGLLSVKLTR